ncbi:DUF1692-domain-containing protein [Ascodesmis nigricans]|uniref:Endoplasmic reticulum-Golgi intermediate compartment protein n=1 Tax=Ascodesmis nigricans TaxID=341454 RepID=A0A4V3SJ83_9PEZI|nr:DUF1692-domain-containing protein [Ascodesmis nigricans]
MARGSRLTKLDAFSKTVEDARIRTTSGGIVTICSVLVVLFLVLGEIRDYRRVIVQPQLVVDKNARGELLPININITFPHLPCSLVTLDVMDISGEQQSGISHGIHLTRLTPHPELAPVSTTQHHVHEEGALHLDPNYCGPCYGAPPPEGHNGCCNTCDDVREAYISMGWGLPDDGKGIEQCEREHYAEHLAEMRDEGCNVAGHLLVNKVVGNFHIAPGKSFTTSSMHVHDLQLYYDTPKEHTMSHMIHHLSFGPELPEDKDPLHAQKVPGSLMGNNPLDGTVAWSKVKPYNYMYFIKVVSTSFLPLGVEPGEPGSLDTHQYSVTSHERNLAGGADADHPDRLHARGGIPGLYFSYDISPMKVINREVRPKSFLSFLTGIFSIIGGTLTVAAAVDRGVYEGGLRVRKLHQG